MINNKIIYVDKNSDIPLFGIDFIGIIDRGTNVIELKPLTLCNLECKYCFVSAGDYDINFIVDSEYIIDKVRETIKIKGSYDIEIHIAPYGESLLYPQLFDLIRKLWDIDGIKIISMQSNGLLLTHEIIKKLTSVNLTRINLSLNTLDDELASYLCNCKNYDANKLLDNIGILLNSGIDVLLAPVWFPGENDKDIEEIIKVVNNFRTFGYSEKQIQIGIQKYLTYKTGRKLKKIRPKTWGYFYKQLSQLERKYNIKLKLGPRDFGIHKRKGVDTLNLKKGDIITAQVVSQGRWNKEYIAKINDYIGIKILLNKPLTLTHSEDLIGKEIKVKVIKANYQNNIITAVFPFKK